MKCFSITRGSNIFIIRSDTFQLKNFINTNLKIILIDNFQPRACNVNPHLRNVKFNINSTQNQNVFQTTTRNLLRRYQFGEYFTFSNDSKYYDLADTSRIYKRFLNIHLPFRQVNIAQISWSDNTFKCSILFRSYKIF